MESSLSLLMANLSKVQKNMLVIDPFVGTGKKAFIYFDTLDWLKVGGKSVCKVEGKRFSFDCFFQEVS